MPQFAPQELFNLCWAFAAQRWTPSGLSAAAALEFESRSSEFNHLEVAGMLWALGRTLRPASTGDAAGVAATLRAADREVPARAAFMEASQLCMAIFGLGRLSQGLPSSASPAVSALSSALENMLLARGHAVPMASLASAVEGFAWGGWGMPDSLAGAIAERIVAGTPTIQPWELCPLAYYLTQLGMKGSAQDLLARAPAPAHIKPRGAVLLLGAMHECEVYPEAMFGPVAHCLSRMSPAYRLEKHLADVLQATFAELPPEQMRRIQSQQQTKRRQARKPSPNR